MEKLSEPTLKYIQKLIKTCSLCGIDTIALEKGIVRGQAMDNSKGTFILETDNVPDNLEFDSLGIGRVKTLGTRIAILEPDPITMSFDGKEKDNGDVMVKKLQMANKKTKIEFSCFDSLRIKAPKKFVDPFCHEFIISDDTLRIMQKTFAAINTSKISFSNEKNGNVVFKTTDVEGDLFDHIVSESFEILPNSPKQNFFHEYEIKYILPLFKAASDLDGKLTVQISDRGALRVNVNSFNIYVIAEH
jgi:hypothetical protein